MPVFHADGGGGGFLGQEFVGRKFRLFRLFWLFWFLRIHRLLIFLFNCGRGHGFGFGKAFAFGERDFTEQLGLQDFH